jgi:hypothetical protein
MRSVILRASTVGIDLLNASAGERGELLHNRAIDQDPQAMTAHGAVLQRPAIDDNLARLIGSSLECRRQWHLITGPGHVEVRYVLDAERDADEHVGTLQPNPVDGVMHRLSKEVRLAGRMRRLRATCGQGVRK